MTEQELLDYQRRQREQKLACAFPGRRMGQTALAKAMLDAKPIIPKKESALEIRFAQQLAEHHIFQAKGDEPMGYWRNWLNAIAGRNFELDFCWPQLRLAVEIDGMAHRTKGRFQADFEKHALLMMAGWKVLRVCGKDVREGRAIAWTMELLDGVQRQIP